MSETDNIVLELLRAIRADVARTRDDIRGLKAEMTSMRQAMMSIRTLVEHDHDDIAGARCG